MSNISLNVVMVFHVKSAIWNGMQHKTKQMDDKDKRIYVIFWYDATGQGSSATVY